MSAKVLDPGMRVAIEDEFLKVCKRIAELEKEDPSHPDLEWLREAAGKLGAILS